jgi:hypothetical protein
MVKSITAEFVQLIASEANEVCDKEGRKTIGAEHVIASLKACLRSNIISWPRADAIGCLACHAQNLGFEHYIEEARSVLEDHLEDKKKRQKLGQKMAQSGLSREELLAQQRALFQQARMRTNSVQAPPQQQDQDSNPQPPGAGAPAPAMRRRSDDDDDDYD